MDERPPWDRPDDDDADDVEEEDSFLFNQEPTEGVRIIGAEEAAEAIERGDVAPRMPDGMPRFGDRPSPPPESSRPALRFPLGGDSEPNDVGRPRVSAPPPPSGPAPQLPHWTDPPTGEVPRILPESAEHDDEEDLDAWQGFAASSGPRWRDHPGDWDSADFDDASMLHDDETRVGALDDRDRPAPDDYFFDEGVFAPGRGTEAAGARSDRATGGGAGGAVPPEGEPTPMPIRTGTRAGATSATRATAPAAEAHMPDRDVRIAVISGLSIFVAAVVCFKIGPALSTVFVGAVIVLAGAELYEALRRAGRQPATLLALVAIGSLVAGAYWRGEAAYPLVLALALVFGMLWFLTGVGKTDATANLAVTLLGIGWIGVLGGFAALLLRIPERQGIAYLLAAVLATVAHDVGSLFFGRRFGHSPLAPTISPNKTWEGFLGGSLAAILVPLIVLGFLPGMHPWDDHIMGLFILGLVVSVVAPLGDLCESMIKRDLGIKDMGSILPGHGGLLDRFDAMLFVLPATYYLVLLLEIGLA